jgi:hypothetical protein
MTDAAWKKWITIRNRWDPKQLIGGFREKTEMNVLNRETTIKNGI